jgi:hypothetical protein
MLYSPAKDFARLLAGTFRLRRDYRHAPRSARTTAPSDRVAAFAEWLGGVKCSNIDAAQKNSNLILRSAILRASRRMAAGTTEHVAILRDAPPSGGAPQD